jgi:signal peptidase II
MKNSGFWIAAIVAFVLDRLTKQWAVDRLLPGPEIRLWPEVFHLTYAENRGAAWSLFENSGGFLKWISLTVVIVLIVLGLWRRLTPWEQVGYGLILAGAAGNGVDRFVAGYVVDLFNFILINFPVFNVADIAINLGVACLLLAVLLEARQSSKAGSEAKSEQEL